MIAIIGLSILLLTVSIETDAIVETIIAIASIISSAVVSIWKIVKRSNKLRADSEFNSPDDSKKLDIQEEDDNVSQKKE